MLLVSQKNKKKNGAEKVFEGIFPKCDESVS